MAEALKIRVIASLPTGEQPKHILEAVIPADECPAFRGEVGVWAPQGEGGSWIIVPVSWLGVPNAIKRGFGNLISSALRNDFIDRAMAQWDRNVQLHHENEELRAQVAHLEKKLAGVL